MLRRRAARLLGFALLVSASTAHAEDEEGASRLFDEGLESMLAGHLEVGCGKIAQSQELDPRPGTLFTLAECYRRWGRVASAVSRYDEYVNVYQLLSAQERARQSERLAVAQREKASLSAQLPWLTVRLPHHAPPSTVVTKDGQPFRPQFLGVAIAVDPGSHEFTTHAPGGPLVQQDVAVDLGERKEVTLDVRVSQPTVAVEDVQLSSEPESASEPGDANDDASATADANDTNTWVYVLGGIGVAGLATGTVTGLLVLDRSTVVEKECSGPERGIFSCSETGKKAGDQAQTLATVTNVAVGVGVVGVGLSLALLLSEDSPTETTRLRPTLSVDATGARVGLTQRF